MVSTKKRTVSVKMVKVKLVAVVYEMLGSKIISVFWLVIRIWVVKTSVTAKLDWKNEVDVVLSKDTIATVVIEVSVFTVVVLVWSSKLVITEKTIRVSVVDRVTKARCRTVNVSWVIDSAVDVRTVVTTFVERSVKVTVNSTVLVMRVEVVR